MKRPVIICSIFFTFFIYSTYCNADRIVSDKRFVLGLDLGVAETKQLGNITKFPLGYSTFNYIPHQKTTDFARYGISLSRKLKLSSLNSVIIGIGYHQLSSKHIKGTLKQGISPPFYSADYQYSIQLSQLLAEIKVQHELRQRFLPYFMAGIGSGFNGARSFSATVPDYLTVTPTFSNHTNSSLSYALGLGIDTLLSPNVTVGVGYLFSDFGQVGLGTGSIRTKFLPNYLNQSHLKINTILVQLNCYL